MICKLCGEDIEKSFARHVRKHQGTKKCEYLTQFPEQASEWEAMKQPNFWKGKTKDNDPGMAAIAAKIKKATSQPHVRKQRSERLKERYKQGGGYITDKETRVRSATIASKAWVAKLAGMTQEERTEALQLFVTAGNEAQKKLRESYTPEDYMRKYPFAKGVARWYNCDQCGQQMVAWFGGKKRSKKRFCNQECYLKYVEDHPGYSISNSRKIQFYSTKMGIEFTLLSKLEEWIAKLLDESPKVSEWCTTPFVIRYTDVKNKVRKFYPDFFINSKVLLEVKSDFVYNLDRDRNMYKSAAAEQYCAEHDFKFLFWKFLAKGYREDRVKADPRVQELLF